MTVADVIVVGSGPAGVSVSWPLVACGSQVLMLDGGTESLPAPGERMPLAGLRRGGGEAWRVLLKPDLSGLRDVGDVSPKLRALISGAFCRAYQHHNRIVGEGIDTIGGLALGGLSNVWGAVSPIFGDRDLDGWPIKSSDMAPAYAHVAARIGISGSSEDSVVQGGGIPLQSPLPLTATAEVVLREYRRRAATLDIKVARSRNAVLTTDRDGRQACDLNGGCMWGCPRRAIYNSADELPELACHDNFRLMSGRAVRRVRVGGGGYVVETLDRATDRNETFEAPIVVLAAGTIPSTRIVLECLGRFDEDLPLLTSPTVGAAWVHPSRLGQPLPSQAFGLAQLAFQVDLDDGHDGYGIFYDAATLSAPDLIRHMSVSRRGAMALFRCLQSAMLICLLYFPGDYSRNVARLERADGGGRLVLRGGYADGLDRLVRRTLQRVAGNFRRLGLHYLPGSGKLHRPGAESHFAGTLAMGHLTTAGGEVVDSKNLFVADGAVFTRLPAKHPTLTVMANAHRIGELIADRIAGRGNVAAETRR